MMQKFWQGCNSLTLIQTDMKLKIINPAILAQSAYQGYKSASGIEEEWKDLPPAAQQDWIAAVSKGFEDFTLGQKPK